MMEKNNTLIRTNNTSPFKFFRNRSLLPCNFSLPFQKTGASSPAPHALQTIIEKKAAGLKEQVFHSVLLGRKEYIPPLR